MAVATLKQFAAVIAPNVKTAASRASFPLVEAASITRERDNMDNKKLTLKPCPFCGNKEINCDFVILDVFAEWFIECENCGAMIKDFSYKSDAIQAWNTRAAQ